MSDVLSLPEVDTRIRTATVRICQACVDLKGEECHTPECVFCFRSVTEAKWLMDKMMIAPIIDGERFVLVDDDEALGDETQRRMDIVVESAVEWHQAGRQGVGWFDKAEALSAAINSLLELRAEREIL